MADETKVVCETPTPGKKPTRIAKWKYDLLRNIILAVVPDDEDGIEFRELEGLVTGRLSMGQLAQIGSVSWYATTVKLDMEVKGEIQRIPGSGPQRLRKEV